MPNLSNPSNTFRAALYPHNRRYCSISASVCSMTPSQLQFTCCFVSSFWGKCPFYKPSLVWHFALSQFKWVNVFLTKGQFMSSKLVLISSLHTPSWRLLFADISSYILFIYKDVLLFVIIGRQSSRVVHVLDPVKDLFVNKLIFMMSLCNQADHDWWATKMKTYYCITYLFFGETMIDK